MKKVLLAEDHSIVIKGISILFEAEFNGYKLDVVKNTTDLMKILKLNKNKYAAVVLDIQLEDGDTMHLIKDIMTLYPTLNILIFSANPEEIFAYKLYQEGVKGFLNKQSNDEEVVHAINLVMEGKIYMSEDLKKILISDRKELHKKNPFLRLSQRELEVTNLLLKGKRSAEICKELNLQPSTVATYKMKVLQKLEINNIIELKQLWHSYGKLPAL